MLDARGFDAWAADYDRCVAASNAAGTYPFGGYDAVLETVFQKVTAGGSGQAVLDLGFGTARLTKRLYQAGHRIFGQDLSGEMLRLAREKMPQARLFCGDLTKGLVPELRDRQYDAIVATYSLHHLPDGEKAPFLKSLLPLLRQGGGIFIGDVAFACRRQLEDCRRQAGERWDEAECYFVYADLKAALPALGFLPLTPWAGVLTLK